MYHPLKSVVIASLIVSSALAAKAAALPTNVVHSISIQLTGTATGTPTTSKNGTITTPVQSVSIANKDVIKALGGGPTAQLLLLRQISYSTNITYTTNHAGKVTTNTAIT